MNNDDKIFRAAHTVTDLRATIQGPPTYENPRDQRDYVRDLIPVLRNAEEYHSLAITIHNADLAGCGR